MFIIAPGSMMAMLLGMALGGMTATIIRAVAIILVGSLVFQVSYAIASLWQLLAVFGLSMVALYGLGMMTSSIFLLLSREAWHLANLAMEPVYLVSGMYFPIRNLGFWTAAAASLIPLTLGLDAMRQLVFSSGATLGFLSVPLEMAILAVLALVFIAAAYYLLKLIEKIAVREGRLTENRR